MYTSSSPWSSLMDLNYITISAFQSIQCVNIPGTFLSRFLCFLNSDNLSTVISHHSSNISTIRCGLLKLLSKLRYLHWLKKHVCVINRVQFCFNIQHYLKLELHGFKSSGGFDGPHSSSIFWYLKTRIRDGGSFPQDITHIKSFEKLFILLCWYSVILSLCNFKNKSVNIKFHFVKYFSIQNVKYQIFYLRFCVSTYLEFFHFVVLAGLILQSN